MMPENPAPTVHDATSRQPVSAQTGAAGKDERLTHCDLEFAMRVVDGVVFEFERRGVEAPWEARRRVQVDADPANVE